MGKSTLIVESYPSFNANHKKDKKQTKTRSAAKLAKIAKFNAQDKANLKAQRRLAQKTIDKSRDRKRKLKATEAGVRDPDEGIQYNQREMTLQEELQTRAMIEWFHERELMMTLDHLARERSTGQRLAGTRQNLAIEQEAREAAAWDQEIEEFDYW